MYEYDTLVYYEFIFSGRGNININLDVIMSLPLIGGALSDAIV